MVSCIHGGWHKLSIEGSPPSPRRSRNAVPFIHLCLWKYQNTCCIHIVGIKLKNILCVQFPQYTKRSPLYNLSLQWTIGGSSAIYLFYSELWGTVVLFTYSLASSTFYTQNVRACSKSQIHSTSTIIQYTDRKSLQPTVPVYNTYTVRV